MGQNASRGAVVGSFERDGRGLRRLLTEEALNINDESIHFIVVSLAQQLLIFRQG